MNIEILNCNNIDLANVSLSENKLNIKFAPNGTGKSSIAKALLLGSQSDPDLLGDLMPFKLKKGNPENKQPIVNGAEAFKSIMCFNEEYVSQFVFKPDELLSNSFDVFIRTEAYRKKEAEIEGLVCNIKQLFTGNQELEGLISTLKEMASAFKLTKNGLSKSSTGMKGLSKGNKIQHIPSGLESYTQFIQGPNSVNWIDWQTKGYDFAELSDDCPFCTSTTTEKIEQIKKVGKEYDKNTIKNLIALIGVIEKLGDFFSSDSKDKLKIITTLKEGIEREHVTFLTTVKKQIDDFTVKLERLRTLSGFLFHEGEKVAEVLPTYRLDLQFFSELESERMQEAIAPINAAIDVVIEQAVKLQASIGQQRREMRRTIKSHQDDINGFLSYAGYRYAVEIAGDGEQSHLRLRHADCDEYLSGGNQHLSFGEKNAFAIVLFMYECLSKKPDLIILDDPISSFDKNKKYAILEMLFRRDPGSCLKEKTVLMLTHDMEPIIDTMKSLAGKFSAQTLASFLYMKDCQMSECVIEKGDLQTFHQICTNALSSAKDDVIKLIYIRRGLEISENKGNAYQVLSNILHKRERAVDSRESRGADGEYPEMKAASFTDGCNAVSDKLPGFSYPDLVQQVSDVNTLKKLYANSENGYEKLQIFRLFGEGHGNSVIQKFINETYHIENEFIYQLDPSKFDTIPEYVVAECDRVVQEID